MIIYLGGGKGVCNGRRLEGAQHLSNRRKSGVTSPWSTNKAASEKTTKEEEADCRVLSRLCQAFGLFSKDNKLKLSREKKVGIIW